jgi:hypothetical protein
MDAGENGLLVKATGERWYAGHNVSGYVAGPGSLSPILYRH